MDLDFGQAYGAIKSYLIRPRTGFFYRPNRAEESMFQVLTEKGFDFNPLISTEENILLSALNRLNMSEFSLREDAYVFLLTNIKYMFVLPVKRVYFIYRNRNHDEFAASIAMIIEDVTRILEGARALGLTERIEAVDVLRITTTQWNQMSTNRDNRFWGGRDG